MKRLILTLFAASLLLIMAACGNADEPTEQTETEQDPETEEAASYTIEHAMGSTEIEKTPERVVILTNEGTEALLALGVKPIGAVQSWLGDPWYEHIHDEMDGVEVVGLESEPSLEKIASLQPDLIIGNKQRHEVIYDQLSAIAPTVFAEALRGDWQENFRLYAKALNLEEKGDEVLTQFEERLSDLSGQLGENLNQEVSVVRFLAGSSRIYWTNSFSGVIFEQLGFNRPEHQQELFTDNTLGDFAIEVGKELIPKMDGDLLFYFTYAPQGNQDALDTAAEWTSDPLWQNLEAVKEGNVHEVSDATWNTAGGVLAAHAMLDDLEKILLEEK